MARRKIPMLAIVWFFLILAVAIYDGILLLMGVVPISGFFAMLGVRDKYLILGAVLILEGVLIVRIRSRHWLILADVALTNLVIGHLLW